MDIICDAVLVGVPVYLLSRMRRIQRKRKIVIVFLCCGSVLTLLVIVIAEVVYYGPFAETVGKDTFINFLLHLSVRFPSLKAVKWTLIPPMIRLCRPRHLSYQPTCSSLGQPSTSG